MTHQYGHRRALIPYLFTPHFTISHSIDVAGFQLNAGESACGKHRYIPVTPR